MTTENQESFRDILNKLKHGECVETISSLLKQILNRAQNATILNTSPPLTEVYSNEIKQNYNKAAKLGIDTKKINNENAALPKSLLIPALQSIRIKSIDQWFNLLLNVQPELYSELLQHINLQGINAPFNELSIAIKRNFFNSEQCQGLGKALAQNNYLLGGADAALIYAISTENLDLITHFCADADLLENVSLQTKILALNKLPNNQEIISYFLRQLSEKKRIEVTEMVDGSSLLHNMCAKPKLILTILNGLPEAERIKAITVRDKSGNTLLHKLYYSAQYLTDILATLPANQRIEAIKEKNHSGMTLLHILDNNLETLKAILTMLPEATRLNAIQERNADGDTLLHKTYLKPKSLSDILTLLPESQRFSAIKLKNNRGEQVLHRSSSFIDSLIAILESLPECHRIEALREKDVSGFTPLEGYSKSLKSLKRILTLLPKDQHFTALDSINPQNKNNNFFFHVEIMRGKSHELREQVQNDPNYLAAAEAAEQLLRSIDHYIDELIQDNSYEKFKQNCTKAIEESRTILEIHRGWKQIIGNITLAILGLGIFYAGAVMYNKSTTGNYLFFKTDSAQKLDKLNEQLKTL